MSIEIRPATEAEMGQIGHLTSYVYGGGFGDGEDNLPAQFNRAEWTLCAFDGPKMVASYATARADGRSMALGGVSIVGTLPEYRRLGLVRRIVEQAFRQMREAGQSVAALWASQAAIYQRYGYSLASHMRRYQIDSVDVNLIAPADESFTVSRHTPAEAFEEIRAVYRDFIADRTLYLHRAKVMWHARILQEDQQTGPVYAAVCRDGSGDAQGYVIYTLRADKVGHVARPQEIVVRDLAWLKMDAFRALWSFLGRHDLVGRITWGNAPTDDPTPELMAEPRMLHAGETEGVWLRIIDVAGALTNRGYHHDGELVIGVAADRETPWNEGRYRLTVSGGSAEVAASKDEPAVHFTIKSLASALCGFRRVRQLANWGLVSGDEQAIGRVDALLATRHAPHCPDHF